jgi:hypothetical protein
MTFELINRINPSTSKRIPDAISNATAVISTIGTIRSTLPFKDYILKPWRIFLSAGLWCRDGSHPYYVNYMVHKKVLEYCENAQRKRNREWRVYQNNQKRRASKVKGGTGDNNEEVDEKKVEKLRIVRISDHCLAHQAWHIVNVITNIFRSMVFKYQEKCEKLLSSSKLVDTIILRPGDLVDDIRVSIFLNYFFELNFIWYMTHEHYLHTKE